MTPAEIKRAKRVRRLFLQLLENSKAGGPARGRFICDTLEEMPDGVDSDAEVIGFGLDLVNGGYATRADIRHHKGEREGLDYSEYAITAKGTALLSEAIPVDPLIEDARIG